MSGIGYGGVVDYAPVTSATATREMAVTGMGDGGVCVGGPALVLNFGVSPTGTTSTLDPRITFSRASNATYFDSTGTLQYAPHNLLTYSEQLDNAAWTKTRTTATANGVAAPDGTLTADKLVEDTSASTSHYTQSVIITPLSGTSYTGSVYIKAAERRYVAVTMTGGGGADRGVFFDTQTGTYTGGFAGGLPYAIENVGNGWYRFSVLDVTTAAASYALRVYVCDSVNNITYTGDGTSGIYVWGAQLNVGALQPYYSTTVKNLLGYAQEFENAAWTKFGMSIAVNLLAYSEQFDNAAWVKQQGAVTANTSVSPDGLQSADVFIPDTNSGDHSLTQLLAGQDLSITRVFSVYLKASGVTAYTVVLRNNAQSIGIQANVDLSAGTITASNYGSPTSVLTPTITPAGNGWFRCTIGGALSATTETLRIGIFRNFTGNATDGVLIWGAQLVQATNAEPYQRTDGTSRAIGYVAPDGSFTADKFVEDTSTGPHYVVPTGATSLAVGQVVTYSVYAKAAERSFLQLILTGLGNAGGNYVAGFDLAAGTAGTPTAGTTSSITSVGNGWYRCRFTVTVLTSATPTRQIRISQNASITPSSYTGDGNSGIYVWGAQFSDSASLDAYTYNPVAAPSAAAYYGPRIEYDPTTLAVKGLLIEEQRTNSIRNNTMQGAVVGTPGTLPTNWSFAGNAALSREIVSIGTDNGINYIDLRIFGTVAAVAFPEMNLLFESTSLAAASVSQSWTATNYVKVVGGSLAGILNGELFIIGYNSASGVTEASAAAFDYATLTGPLSAHRLSHTRTLTNASTVFVNSRIDVNFTAGGGTAVDVTLRIGLSQLEQGAFATSVIPTSTTALTRSADVALMQGANFSNWYNLVEGTLFAEFGPYANGGATRNFGIVQMDDGTSNNMIRFFAGSTVSPVFQVTTATVTQAYLSSETIANTSVSKISGAYKTNDFARSVNNTATTTDLTGTVPPVTRMIFGMGSIGVNELNGYLRSFSYYPTRLPNAALRALTS